MCGIVGIFAPGARHNIGDCIAAGMAALQHRGPDDSGLWVNEEHSMALGHTRLSIIDLEGGHQPMHHDQYHSVVNGEFYNYRVLRHEFSQQGFPFTSQSDSEVLLPLYRQHQESATQKLEGEFAFILADQSRHRLWGARDRFGSKPLYYSQYRGATYLASEIKALFAMGVPARWGKNAYSHRHMWFGFGTLFESVYALPPGHTFEVSEQGLTIEPYWDINYPKAGFESELDSESMIEGVKNQLLNATSKRLHADVPVGVYLSGGIDSSAILGMASELSATPVKAFNIAFTHEDYNEGKIAKKSADVFGAELHSVSVSQDDLADHFFDAVYHCEAVSMNSHAAAKYLLSRHVHEQGIKVVLTGEGADELFGGYPAFRQDQMILNSGTKSATTDLIARNRLLSGVNVMENPGEQAQLVELLGFTPSWLSPLLNITGKLSDLWPKPTQWYPEACVKDFCDTFKISKLKEIDPLHASMWGFTKTLLPNYFLTTLGDRMEMAHGVEGRQPFLDHQLAAQVSALPSSIKIKQGKEKYILREAMRSYVTDEVYQGQKHPFAAPPAVMDVTSRLYSLVRDSLSSPALASIPMINAKAVNRFWTQLPSMAQEDWPVAEAIVMEILSLVAIEHHFSPSD